MSIEHRGGNTYRFRIQHKKIKYSTTWEGDKSQVKAMHDLFVAEVRAGKYQAEAEEAQAKNTETLGHIWDLYIKSKDLEAGTILNHAAARKHFEDLLARDIASFTKAEMLAHYTANRKTKVDYEYRKLQAVFNFAMDLDLIDKNPINFKMRTFEKESFPELLEEEEIRRLIQAIIDYDDPYIRCVLLLQITTGMRIGEALGITSEVVDTENHAIFIDKQIKVIGMHGKKRLGKPKTKSSIRTVFVPKIAREQLYPLLDTENPTARISINKATKKGLTSAKARYVLKKICADIGIKKISTHKLRNLYTTISHYSEMNTLTISKNLGHASVKMTESYLTKIASKEKAESEKIDRYFG